MVNAIQMKQQELLMRMKTDCDAFKYYFNTSNIYLLGLSNCFVFLKLLSTAAEFGHNTCFDDFAHMNARNLFLFGYLTKNSIA